MMFEMILDERSYKVITVIVALLKSENKRYAVIFRSI